MTLRLLAFGGKLMNDSKQHTTINHPYRDKTDKHILKRNPWKDYGLHLTVFILSIIAMAIGVIELKITDIITISLMPILFSMGLGLICYLSKSIFWIERKQARIAEGAMMLFIGILIAKLAVSSGSSLHLLLDMGPALILQEFGHLATVLIVLPVALLLGFKREAIGMTNSIGREPEVGVVVDKFGFNSPESRGIFALFIIGTILGTVFISFITSISVSVLPLHPYAFAMASGVGSASMNAAAIGPTISAFPGMKTQIEAFAGFSNLLSFSVGIYIVIFVALPMTEKLYEILEPKIGRNSVSSQEEEE